MTSVQSSVHVNARRYNPPMVFASYRLDFGPYGNTPAGYTQDILDAQASGIDGFQLDMFGWDQATTASWANFPAWAGYMFGAAQTLGTGFKLFFMVDFQQYGTAAYTAAANMMTAYKNHPNYWYYGGKPVMGGWHDSMSGTAGSADNTFWTELLSAVGASSVFFWPNFTGLTLTYNNQPTSLTNTNAWFNPWIRGVVNGIATWNNYLPDPIFPNNWTFSSLAANNSIPFMANISCWLSQIRYYYIAYNGGTSETAIEYLEYNGYEGMSNIWQDLITNNRTRFVCINEWNDFTESYMSPATQAQLTATLTRWSAFADWVAGSGNAVIVDSAATDSDGGNRAASWARTTTAATYIGETFTKAASALPYTFTIKAKPNIGTNFAIRLQGVFPSRADVVFSLTSTGSISTAAVATSTFTSASASISALSGGWYQCSLTATSSTNAVITPYFSFNSNNSKIDGTDSAANSAGWLYDATLSQGANIVQWQQWGISGDYLYRHDGFAALHKYFIQWFKTGVQPTWPDSVYVSYRKAAMSVVPSVAPALPVPTWDVQGHNATLNDIYVTTILTAPATLSVNTNGTVTSGAVASGLVHTRVPFAAGATQTVTVTRSAVNILTVTGDAISSALTYYYNSNPLTFKSP